MAIFSIAVRTSGATLNTSAAELIAGTNNAFRLLELGLTINAATASVFGYGTPAAAGITPGTLSTVQAEDAGNTTAGTARVALTWGTSPTNPTNFLRRVSLPATIGAGIVWTFPRGRSVLKTVTDTLQNIVTGSVADVWFVVDE
jgi:hypothetical protein